jgi:hypothetical protein
MHFVPNTKAAILFGLPTYFVQQSIGTFSFVFGYIDSSLHVRKSNTKEKILQIFHMCGMSSYIP